MAGLSKLVMTEDILYRCLCLYPSFGVALPADDLSAPILSQNIIQRSHADVATAVLRIPERLPKMGTSTQIRKNLTVYTGRRPLSLNLGRSA